MSQGIFISDFHPPRHKTFRVRDDLPGPVSVTLPPGATFRVYEDAECRVIGIVVYHETVDEDGTRRGHENDFSLQPPSYHTDEMQTGGVP